MKKSLILEEWDPLEMDFKLNSTLQNRLVKWGLHSLIYYEITLSLANVGLPIASLDNLHSTLQRLFFFEDPLASNNAPFH